MASASTPSDSAKTSQTSQTSQESGQNVQPHYRPYPKRGSWVPSEVEELVGSPDPTTLSDIQLAAISGQHKRVHGYLHKALTRDRDVRFLIQTITANGCTIKPRNFFQVVHCSVPSHGFFYLSPRTRKPSIALCQNNLRNYKELQRTLFHELIHAYDYCTVKFDIGNCSHSACSEVRASALSNDCKMMLELSRGSIGWSKHHQRCVRRRAEQSVRDNRACRDQDSWKAVDQVFDRCYRDTAPFDGHYPWD